MLSRYIIVHFPSGDRTLYDKFVSLLNFLISCPGTGKNTFESHLILAKIHLLADRYPEALRELDTLRTLRSQPPPGTGPTQLTGRPSEVIQTLGRSSRDSLRVHVQDILAKSIQELLEKKADQSLLDGKFDVAIALQKEAERLHHNPLRSAVWRHLSLAEASLEKGMAREAAGEYKRSLPLCRTFPYESYVLKKILDIENLPFGYLIWRNEGVWEIRWWSRMKRTFSGTVESSRSFRSLGVFRLAFGENCRYSRKRAAFQGIVEGDKMQGLTLSVKRRSRLTFRLEIKGQREIIDHVILLPEDTHPREMPFSLEEH
jgi:hypothetical protein